MIRVGRLHVITDTTLQQRWSHAELTRLAIENGADTVQYRQKVGSTRDLIAESMVLRDLGRKRGVAIVVNDRVDVAIAADAGGVHLGAEDLPISIARALLGPAKIIGGSADSADEAIACAHQGADYVGIGPIFSTRSKLDTGAVLGLDTLRAIVVLCPVPVIAIGGITEANAASVLATGVHGIAILSAICCADDPGAAAARFAKLIGAAL